MRLALNEPIQIPRPLFLDESSGNLRLVEKAEFSVEPPELAYIDPETLTATGLMPGEGKCTVSAELGGIKLSKVVNVVVPIPQMINVPADPPAFVPTSLVVPGE